MIRKRNPLYFILAWIALTVAITIGYMIILGISTPGGEQKPFSFLGRAVPVIICGVLVIAIAGIFLYFEWSKRFWYINLFIIAACTFFFLVSFFKENRNLYFLDSKTIMVNGKNIEQKIEYYDSKSTKIRSRSFYVNGKKDSTWMVFAKDGTIISQSEYKKGELIDGGH